MEPQRELNRSISQLSRILELSGNPICVLENVEQAQDITVKPGAVWTIPEDAKAYLLDLLQGGGVSLHIDYINLLYRILHDISESPRAAFGGTERDLSGVALELELNPLLQKVRRKQLIRTAVYNRRHRMILQIIEKFQNEKFPGINLHTVWTPVLPQDVSRDVANEQTMVQMGLHSPPPGDGRTGRGRHHSTGIPMARWKTGRDLSRPGQRTAVVRGRTGGGRGERGSHCREAAPC